jgi:hypothetical protein
MTYDKRKRLLTRLRKDVCRENILRGQVYLIIQEDNSRKSNIEHSKKNSRPVPYSAHLYSHQSYELMFPKPSPETTLL